jgi:hypothetical protein
VSPQPYDLAKHRGLIDGAHGIPRSNHLRVISENLALWQAVVGNTALQAIGGLAITVEGTPTENHAAVAPFLRFPTIATIGNRAGEATAFSITRSTWMPKFTFLVTPDTAITSVRYWIGFTSADLGNSATPVASIAAWRYDTAADTASPNWRCVTSNGSTFTVVDSGIPVIASEPYLFGVEFEGVPGTAPTAVIFTCNRVIVARITTTLPATGSNNLGIFAKVTALAAAIRALNISVIGGCTRQN